MFQNALLFWVVRIIYHSKQTIVKVVGQIPPPFTSHTYQIIVDCFSPIVIACHVLNQSCGHWLLNDALNYAISMVLKLKDALEILPFIQNLVEEQSIGVDELTSFASNIIMEVCVVLKSFLSFLRKLEKKKALICFL